jgi:hypothetical protein
MSKSKYDKLRIESDRLFWAAGLSEQHLPCMFVNGVKYSISAETLEVVAMRAIYEAVLLIQ